MIKTSVCCALTVCQAPGRPCPAFSDHPDRHLHDSFQDQRLPLPREELAPRSHYGVSSSSFSLTPNPSAVETGSAGKQAKSNGSPRRARAWRGARAPPRPAGGLRASAGLGPRQMSRQHQGQLPNCSPPPPTAARAEPAARSPPARARALPPARAPRRGLGGSRACRSQGASLRVPSRRGRSRSWQGAPAPARSRLPRASGPPQRQSRPPCPSRRRSPWPGQERPPVAAPCPGRTPDRPVTCAQVLGRPGQRRSHGSR